jgi:hypothetical protein
MFPAVVLVATTLAPAPFNAGSHSSTAAALVCMVRSQSTHPYNQCLCVTYCCLPHKRDKLSKKGIEMLQFLVMLPVAVREK